MDRFQEQRSKIIDYLIAAIATALIPIAGLIIFVAFREGWSLSASVQLAMFSVIWILALKRSVLSLHLRGSVVILFLFLTALSEVFRVGLVTATYPTLAVLPVLGTVVGGVRIGVFSVVAVVLAITGAALFSIVDGRVPASATSDYLLSPVEWTVRVVNVAIAAAIGVFVTGMLYRFHQASSSDLEGQDTKLAKSQSRVMQSATLAGLGYAVADIKAGRIIDCDENFASMHGMSVEQYKALDIREDVVGRIVHSDDREAAKHNFERLKNGEALIADFRHHLPSGKIKNIRKIFSPLHPDDPEDLRFEVVGQDVTETHELQAQLFQIQRVEAIGKLTGGIAHDFNNLLSVILGNLELLEEELADAEQQRLVRTARDATLAGSELTRNMLAFARRASLQPTMIDLNQHVENMKNWIERTLPASISVETSLLAGLWPIEVDASSLESGLLNLIVNARDAMPNGGSLTIETSNLRIDEDYVDARGEGITPGPYVLLAVSDTGEGIASELLDEIFVPFFTTKPVGSGSGLGLSMLEGFMKQSGGTVQVYSELGVGTSFKLYFKAVTRETEPSVRPELVPRDVAEVTHGVVLVVEDNAEVMAIVRKYLVRSGFSVIEASSGDEAVSMFESEPIVDLLLTDIVMPGKLQGTMLAKKLREVQPNLPVVFMSGYASEAAVHGNGLGRDDIRLMKPVQRDELLGAVNQALCSTGANSKRI